MQNNICDNCGKAGTIAPQTRVRTEMAEMEIQIPDPNDKGNTITQKVGYEKPVTRTVKRQNVFTKLMEDTEEPELEDLQERIIRVELAIGFGAERISREFCSLCIHEVKAKLKETWNVLESYDPK